MIDTAMQNKKNTSGQKY